MGRWDWIWAVVLGGGATAFFWKDICNALSQGGNPMNLQCPPTWISDGLMQWLQAFGKTPPAPVPGAMPSALGPIIVGPGGKTTSTGPSQSANPVTGAKIPVNPGGTKASCAGLNGSTCKLCCDTKTTPKGLPCDCDLSRYTRRSYRTSKVKHMRSFNKMVHRTAYTSYQATGRFGLRKLPTVYG